MDKLKNMMDQIAKSQTDQIKKIADSTREAHDQLIKTITTPPKIPDFVSTNAMHMPIIDYTNPNLASEFRKRLMEWIIDFDAALDDEHEVGIHLVSFGQAVRFHFESIGYYNPSLICFTGKLEDGDPVELIQHVSQISIMLVKMMRQDPSQPKKRIGFIEEEGLRSKE